MEIINETRLNNFKSDNIKTRAYQSEEGKKYISGYAAVFNQRSKLLYEYIDGKYQEFYEIILPGSFDNVLRNDNIDVRLTFNHNYNSLIARYTKENGIIISNSLELGVDEYGLYYRTEVPETSLGNDIYVGIVRGELYENSFQFGITTNDEKTYFDNEGNLIREINNMSGLYDVSVVVSGAYKNTLLKIDSRGILNLIEQKSKSVETPLITKTDFTYYENKLNVLKKVKK